MTVQQVHIIILWYIFFWVFPRRLNIKSRRFGTHCRFHLHGWVGVNDECSETSAFNIQTPGKYPEENIPYLQHAYIFFWVLPRRLNIKSRRFGTHFRFHLHGWVGVNDECSETSAFNMQTPGKYSEENIPYLQHGESLKTTIIILCWLPKCLCLNG
jgi:hypothetical protein